MKEILAFKYPGCPYCAMAFRAVDKLREDNPEYKKVKINWVDETAQPDLSDKYDYYACPSLFVENKKIYEATIQDKYEDVKRGVKAAFDFALL